MSGMADFAMLQAPHEIGIGLAERMRNLPRAFFERSLDVTLAHMRDELLEAGRPVAVATLICHDARQAAWAEWNRSF